MYAWQILCTQPVVFAAESTTKMPFIQWEIWSDVIHIHRGRLRGSTEQMSVHLLTHYIFIPVHSCRCVCRWWSPCDAPTQHKEWEEEGEEEKGGWVFSDNSPALHALRGCGWVGGAFKGHSAPGQTPRRRPHILGMTTCPGVLSLPICPL